jgi:16S rRNA (cytosine967-C5)-methyltransferase
VSEEIRRARPGRGRPSRPALRRGAPSAARQLALRVLERVERERAYSDVLLHALLVRGELHAADRAFATELVQGTLRWRGRLDFLLARVLDRGLDELEPLVASALRLGAYQIAIGHARTPPEVAVDEAVRCVRAAGAERVTGLVNAVLRRLAAEHAGIAFPDLERDPLGHLTHALSLPAWLAERWLGIFGPDEAAALARASNEVPPLVVRANRLRTDRDALLAELRARFPEAEPCRLARDGIRLGRRGNPALDPAFLAGHFTVQDEASQLVAALVDPRPGERVLDLCAAPGGKATALAERLAGRGEVVAIDRHERRLALVVQQARRLGIGNLRCAARDATRPLVDLAAERAFDRALVDAPCSGLGTLRRNPDARWRVAASDPARLAETQLAILRQAAAAVVPGGVLVYSTCTLLPEENESTVKAFLAEAPHFRLAAPEQTPSEARALVGPDGFLRTLPHRHDADGFFAARLEREP